MSDKPSTGPVEFQLPNTLENPLGLQSAYANSATAFTGQWDVRLVFSELVTDGKSVRNELRGNIVMSYAHAKAFAQTFERLIKEYEEQFGEIKWPNIAK